MHIKHQAKKMKQHDVKALTESMKLSTRIMILKKKQKLKPNSKGTKHYDMRKPTKKMNET